MSRSDGQYESYCNQQTHFYNVDVKGKLGLWMRTLTAVTFKSIASENMSDKRHEIHDRGNQTCTFRNIYIL